MAARAGVALAATTYYFSSLDDLLTAAVAHLAADWLQQAEAALARLPLRLTGPEQVAHAVVDVVLVGADDAVTTMYERYLQAGRSALLRPVVTAYGTALDALLLDVLRRGQVTVSGDDVRQVLAVVDGTALRALAEGRPPRPAACAAVADLLRAGQAGSSTRPPA